MKRGNTALKRGVGLASAFALAIAGAVIAAPAANAAALDGTDNFRVTPVANAANADSTGAAAKYVFGRVYGSGGANAATGKALVLKAGASGQQVQGLQVALPKNFAANTDVTITLNNNTTFAGVPSVTLDPVERKSSDLSGLAGYTGDNATVAGADGTAGSDLAAGTLGTSSLTAANELTVNLAKAAPNLGSGVYLLSINNVAVNVAAGATLAAPVTASLVIGSTAAGVTTIGYIGKYTLAIASGPAEADGGDLVLPDVVLAEAGVAGITAPTKINITSDATGAVLGDNTKAKVTVSGSTATAALTATTGAADFTITPTLAGDSGTKLETYTVSGLTLKSVPAKATVTLTVDSSNIAAVNKDTAGTANSNFAFTASLAGVSASLDTTVPEPRLAGSDRYDTAAKIAAKIGGKTTVVIANGETGKAGVDALSANYLAKAVGAPILLTAAKSLPTSTQAALISRFKAHASGDGDITIYVMGKTDSVSAAVRAQIESIVKTAATLSATEKVTVKEIAGANRYSTSAAAATEAGVSALQVHSLDTAKGWYRTAFLASGTVNADALAAGSASAAGGMPVFLTNGTALDADVQKAIKDLGIQQVIALGGTDRVSDALLTSLSALGVANTSRISASDRYKTAAALYTWAFATTNPTGGVTARGLGWTTGTDELAYIANGTDGFADALAVGPLAAASNNPILTSAVGSLSDAAIKFLKDNKAEFGDGILALGQSDRISSAVITAAEGALE